MKKFILFVSLMFLGIAVVNASGIAIEPIYVDGKYTLQLTSNEGVSISYEEAYKQGLIEETLELYLDDHQVYFIMGHEVSEEEYRTKYAENEADDLLASYGELGIRVHNTEDIINAIKNIYEDRLSDEYHLVYSTLEYEKLDLAKINAFFRENYMSDIDQNAYHYREYGLRQPLKYEPIFNDNEVIINGGISKISVEEEDIVSQFLPVLDRQLENKSDYEKILAIYNYLKRTTKYVTDDGYSNFQDGQLSPYDVLIKRKGVCIGLATTFQFLAEHYNIESYIIDKVYEIDENSHLYHTIHTYNIVKLDNNWYIIDINQDEDNFLLGSNSSKYDRDDFKYLNITLAESGYLEEHPDYKTEDDLDYAILDNKVQELNNIKVNKETNEETNKEVKHMNNNDLIAYILLVLILFSIFMVVLWFTRKK